MRVLLKDEEPYALGGGQIEHVRSLACMRNNAVWGEYRYFKVELARSHAGDALAVTRCGWIFGRKILGSASSSKARAPRLPVLAY